MINVWPHFIRPEWLYSAPFFLLGLFYLFRTENDKSLWQRLIPKNYQRFLIQNSQSTSSRVGMKIALTVALIGSFIALLGPSWSQKEYPLHVNDAPQVIVLDLSQSMTENAEQFSLAKRKIIDLLALSTSSDSNALVVYAGTAHTVTPLTRDRQTIESLLPSVVPGIMPKMGNNTLAGIKQALSLLTLDDQSIGSIVLITNEISAQNSQAIQQLLSNYPEVSLSVLAFSGNSDDRLKALAKQENGLYQPVTVNDRDVKALQQERTTRLLSQQEDMSIIEWQDDGFWFFIPLLLVVAFAARRGLLFCLPLGIVLLTTPSESQASWFDSLRYNSNQQAEKAFNAGDYETAAEKFVDPEWRAYTDYQRGNLKESADFYQSQGNAEGWYNYGNVLAKEKKFEEAIQAWETALELKPDFPAAAKNKAIVEEFLKQQQQQQEEDESQDSSQQDSSQNESQESSQQDQSQNEPQDSSQQDQSQNESQDSSQQDQSQNEPQDSSPQDQSQNEPQDSSPQDKSQNEPQDSSQQDESQRDSQDSAAEEENASQNSSQNPSEENGDQQSHDPSQDEASQNAAHDPSLEEDQENSSAAEDSQKSSDDESSEKGIVDASLSDENNSDDQPDALIEDELRLQEELDNYEQMMQTIPLIPDNASNLLRNKFNREYKLQGRGN